jgi:hypothetical protein
MGKGSGGGGAGGGDGGSQVGGDTFGASNAKVTHLDYTKKEISTAIKDTLGKNATLQDVASAVGAPDDARVNISEGGGGIYVNVTGPGYKAQRLIYKDANGKTVIENIHIETTKTGTGLGTKIFGRQVEQASKLGVDRIQTFAAGPAGGYNGYYTWARLGYDAKIPSSVKLPSKFKNAKNVSDLMRTKAGAKFWKEHGTSVKMTFNLKRGSTSQRALSKYLKKKGLKDG